MMQFAQPLGLLALVSIPVIILLHLLRPRRRTITVSSTALWSEALRERQRGLGLHQLFQNLSLVLLILAALIASLTLAEPRWLTESTEHHDIVIVVDASASMRARAPAGTRLDQARGVALELIDSLPQGARALIITSAHKAVLRSGFETNTQLLRRAVKAIQNTDEAGNPHDALALASSLLRSREDGRIYFITDAAFETPLGMGGERVRYRLVGQNVNDKAGNVAITRFDFRTEPGRENRFQVLLSVHNFTDTPVTLPVKVELERRELFNRDVEIAADSTRTLVMPFAGKALGRATASIDIDDDLPSDNRAWAVTNVTERTHVLLYTSGNFYLQSVLNALPNVELTLAPPEDLENSLDNLEREARLNDVVIFDRVPVPQLPAGNFLLIGTLPPNLPVQAGGTVFNPRIQGNSDSALVQGIDLSAVRIDQALRIPPQPPSARVQRLFWDTDTELALALLDERTRIVLLAFDIAQSNFAIQAAFPLFISRTLDWLRPQGIDRPRTQIKAGEPYAIQTADSNREIIIRTPQGDGEAYRIKNGELLYENTSTAGIYRYSVNDVARYFAVNLTDKGESNITPRAAELINPRSGLVNSGSEETESNEVSALSARKLAQTIKTLWPQFAALLLILLLAEWLLWCTGRRHA
ncbi:MAG: Ca-activated chloride channel family protein [Gammaproteobacteria bacterium]|jgi:Ca-activated chloride channel family protein